MGEMKRDRKLLRCVLCTDGAIERRKHSNPRVRAERREKTNRYGYCLNNRSLELEILNGVIITTVFDVDDTGIIDS
jgi:hypothetical protein